MRSRLVLLAIGLGLFLLAFVGQDAALRSGPYPAIKDVDMYEAVMHRVAAGDPYYRVLAEELPARGYAIRPVFHWRPPTLAWLIALLPSIRVAHGVLWAIGALAIVEWWRVLRPRPLAAIGLVFLAPLWLIFDQKAVFLHELWAGELIALSLALWIRGSAWAIVVAAAAIAVREHAVLFVGVMAIVAASRSPRSALPWLMVLVLAAVGFGLHAWAVARVMPADGHTLGWSGLLGWAFVVKTARVNVVLIAAPYWLAAACTSAAVVALVAWMREREGTAVAFVVFAYLSLFAIAGRPDNWYWGLLIGPLLPLGLLRVGAPGARRPQPHDRDHGRH